jgi:transcriptional regulator with XRE-family HTH domain
MEQPPDILVRLGRAVRARRLALGLSQEDLAAESGLDRTYISGIERGQRNVALRNTERLAQALRLSLSELMEGL